MEYYFLCSEDGCQWCILPSDSAPWELVYYYYRKWSSLGEFDLLLNNLREKVHVKIGQQAETSIPVCNIRQVAVLSIPPLIPTNTLLFRSFIRIFY